MCDDDKGHITIKEKRNKGMMTTRLIMMSSCKHLLRHWHKQPFQRATSSLCLLRTVATMSLYSSESATGVVLKSDKRMLEDNIQDRKNQKSNVASKVQESANMEQVITNSLDGPLVWIDLETTGLHVDRDEILEIACIITDGGLTRIITGPNIIIHKNKETLRKMDDWCINQHGNSGLIESCLSSTVTTQEAEESVLRFIKEHVPQSKVGILAGSSVHFDKEFLRKEMPTLFEHLHYRIVDVTSVGELVKRWFPTVLRRRPRKQGNHRALGDIQDSIRELEFYKNTVFRLR